MATRKFKINSLCDLYVTFLDSTALEDDAIDCIIPEPPHVRGQGQKSGGPHAQRAAAKRSYPTSEVRGSGREYRL